MTTATTQNWAARIHAVLINMFLTPSTLAQHAALAAMDEREDLERWVRIYAQNRTRLIEGLAALGIRKIVPPDGAFYLFPRIDGVGDSFEFCRQLLVETRVGLAPGVAFGAGGEGSVRICYAAEQSILEDAMERLGRFLANHPR